MPLSHTNSDSDFFSDFSSDMPSQSSESNASISNQLMHSSTNIPSNRNPHTYGNTCRMGHTISHSRIHTVDISMSPSTSLSTLSSCDGSSHAYTNPILTHTSAPSATTSKSSLSLSLSLSLPFPRLLSPPPSVRTVLHTSMYLLLLLLFLSISFISAQQAG